MLSLKKKLWIVKQKGLGDLTDSQIASAQDINRMTVHRLWVKYQEEGREGLLYKELGRPKEQLSLETRQRIISLRKQGNGIRKIEGLLNQEGIRASHNKIHELLTNLNLVAHEPKKGRRYNYIRWERKHSNSLWQTDFCWIPRLDCWLTAWLDDHSRFITIANYVTEATTDTSISLFEKAAKKYGYPMETLSDQGTQYCSQLGETCRFLEHMKSKSVKHIYASVRKPTTCGKIERFWGTHNRERWNFPNLRKFIEYYNYKRPHMSLNWYTPYAVYVKDKM